MYVIVNMICFYIDLYSYHFKLTDLMIYLDFLNDNGTLVQGVWHKGSVD